MIENNEKENIVNLLGINSLSPEEQDEELSRTGKLIFKETIRRASNILSKEDLVECEKLLNPNIDFNAETLINFLSSKVPSFWKIVKEETDKLIKLQKTTEN